MDMSTDNLDIMQFFVSMLVVGIGVALFATGTFTAYFGAGKSKQIGIILIAVGFLTLASVYAITDDNVDFDGIDLFDADDFKDALTSGISALAGLIIGMFLILFVLMKVDTVDDLADLDLENLEDLDLDEELKKLEKELNQAENKEDEPDVDEKKEEE